jgi:hypothetical protein
MPRMTGSLNLPVFVDNRFWDKNRMGLMAQLALDTFDDRLTSEECPASVRVREDRLRGSFGTALTPTRSQCTRPRCA